MCKAFLPGCIFWLQPDQVEERRRREDSFHYTIWGVLLSGDAFRPKKMQEQPTNE
jgi:hypothetical protein